MANGTRADMRVVILGDRGVGKTSLIGKLVGIENVQESVAQFDMNTYHHAFTFGRKEVNLEIVDSPSGFTFLDGDAFVLVFSLIDDDSFEKAAFLREAIVKRKPKGTPIVLVGNKMDSKRSLHITSRSAARRFAKYEWNIPYIEASATHGTNVAMPFQEVWFQRSNTPPLLRKWYKFRGRF